MQEKPEQASKQDKADKPPQQIPTSGLVFEEYVSDWWLSAPSLLFPGAFPSWPERGLRGNEYLVLSRLVRWAINAPSQFVCRLIWGK